MLSTQQIQEEVCVSYRKFPAASDLGRSWSRQKTENCLWNHNRTMSSWVRLRNQTKTIRSQLLRSVTQNPGDFPLKQRFPLPASVSGALGEAWVPSAPQWPPHTTACPARQHRSHRLEKLISTGKGRKRVWGIWGTTALGAGRGFCS